MKALSGFTLLWLLILSLGTQALAQVYNITRYSTDDGLVQSQVMAMTQDRWGYLWMGTHRGIARFDGRKFEEFGTELGLASTFVSALAEAPQGGIWVGTDNGLSYYNGHKFTNLSWSTAFPSPGIRSLMLDRDSTLWIGTESGHLGILRDSLIELAPLQLDQPGSKGSIDALLTDSKGRVWIGTSRGLYLAQKTAAKLVQASYLGENTEIHALTEDPTGQIWVGTNSGVVRYDGDVYSHHDLSAADVPDRSVYCLVADERQVWLGTGNGLIRYDGKEWLPLKSGDRSLAYRMASAIFDSEGNIWFGTDGGGARKITEGIFDSYGMAEDLSSNLAKSFLEDELGRIWISTKDRGINVLDAGKIVAQYTTSNGLGGDDIVTSFEDSKGQFWFTSYNGTLTRYANGQFKAFDREDGLNCNGVFAVSESPNGRLFIGTDNGIYSFDGNRFKQEYTSEDGLPDNTVYALHFDGKQQLWMGTSAGLAIANSEEVVSFEPDQTIGNNVITLIEDNEGRIWVGSSVGLTCFEENKPSYVRISGASGAHTVVALVIEDGTFLWVGTENGAYRLDLTKYESGKRNKFAHFTQKDGLPSLECNANAAFQDSQGDIWIGTAEGAIYRPAGTVTEDRGRSPRVYITGLKALSDEPWTAFGYELNAFGLPTELSLPYTENRAEFTYIGISLRSPQQVEYRFMLEGVDDDWGRPTRQTSVVYSNLDPGSYTFRVSAKRESEPWNLTQYATYSFEIEPPFWQTWWFLLFMLIVLSGIGYSIYYNISTRRRRQREQLRLQNAAEKLQLEHQALYAMMNPHFTFNALQSIQFFIHRQDKKAANKFLSSFAKLVRKNLESTKVDFISLGEEVDRLKIYLSLEKMRFPEKFDYEVVVSPDVDLAETQLPPMLLQPFVENSIKHGIMPLDSDGLIEVVITQKDVDYLQILIKDNGIGVEASKRRKANRPNDHVSKGMQITKDRLALFARISRKKYSLDIREVIDDAGTVEGTLVEMILPVRQEVIDYA